MANPMTRMIDGIPGFLVSPRCRVARKGLAGGYHLRRLQVAGMERYRDEPEKNRYSHVVEAGQYALIGAGEGESVVGMDGYDDEPDWRDFRTDYERNVVSGY